MMPTLPTPKPKPGKPPPTEPEAPDGDFEITDEASLQTAIDAVKHVDDAEQQRALREFIVEQAIALGLVDMLPDEWPEVSGQD